MPIIKPFLLFLLLFSYSELFCQVSRKALQINCQELYSELQNPVIDKLEQSEKYGYFFLMYKVKIVEGKVSKVDLLNRDTAFVFSEIAALINTSLSKRLKPGKGSQNIVLPVVLYDLRGECFQKPLNNWFSGTEFKNEGFVSSVIWPPFVVGYSRRIQ